jgi:hypothetical protein
VTHPPPGRLHRLAQHTSAGSSTANLVRLVAPRRHDVDLWSKVAFCAVAAAALAPLRTVDRVAFRRRRPAWAGPGGPPIFVVGHWRSGTTHLHNLLALDPELGFLSTAQAIFPQLSLVGAGLAKGLVRWLGPNRRPMDEMAFAAELPQEDEFALANMCTASFYTATLFPRLTLPLFDRYCSFRTASADEVQTWATAYAELLDRTSMASGSRRVVSKNPANTARIDRLRRLFPGARFVHIRRNPYEVFYSTLQLQRTLVRMLSLQRYEDAEAVDVVLAVYRRLLEPVLREPAAPDVHELAYEDLVRDPLGTMRGIYAFVGLPWRGATERRLSAYLAQLAGYRRNHLVADRATLDLIDREWSFALDHWGYRVPDVLRVAG